MPKITISDFLESFGAEANSMTQECIDLINSKNFNYEVVECNRRDEIILDVLKKIESDKQVVGAIERKDIWNNGWTENLQEFMKAILREKLFETSEVSKQELDFLRKLHKVSEENNLHGTEKELFSKLNKKKNIY